MGWFFVDIPQYICICIYVHSHDVRPQRMRNMLATADYREQNERERMRRRLLSLGKKKTFFFFFCICKVAREMEINQTPIGIRGGGRLRCRWGVPGRSERKSSKSNIKIDLGRAISSKGKPNRENAEQKPREPKAAE